MRGCHASLGNDEILEFFALNAKIFGAEFNYCVSKVNPNTANRDLVPQEVRFQHPKSGVKF